VIRKYTTLLDFKMDEGYPQEQLQFFDDREYKVVEGRVLIESKDDTGGVLE
jgi:hypothetical protein